ncbi:MAG: hypothetical protein K2N48_07320 [Muribaculaceae bacterium]|nr:hypothetical protein [Muribaculaceae bacterium]
MTNKLTNKKALAVAVDVVSDYDGFTFAYEGNEYDLREVVAKLEGMIAALDNKAASTKRKPTAKQFENEGFKAKILDFLRANPNHFYTCTEIGKGIPELNDLNNQRISALMRGLKDDSLVEKVVEKGKSYFSAVVVEIERGGD